MGVLSIIIIITRGGVRRRGCGGDNDKNDRLSGLGAASDYHLLLNIGGILRVFANFADRNELKPPRMAERLLCNYHVLSI